MKAYLDSSFVFSLYFADAHSEDAADEASQFKGELVISSLTELEVLNSIELRVYRREIRKNQAEAVRAVLEQDLQRGVYLLRDISPETFARARTLVFDSSAQVGCRTADILHVAAALDAGADVFMSFDNRQKSLATRVRLRTN